jgi:type I restriction-modification system DNA methylase subunit
MKFNGEIQKLLQRKCHNEQDYYHQVVWPFLDILDIPQENSVRYPQFRISTFLGEQRTDFLILIGDIPVMAVEAKFQTKKFEEAKEQVKFFSTNFDPITKAVRKQTVPFQLVLAGNKAQLFRITIKADGITPDLKPLRGFLEWSDLLKESEAFRQVPILERGQIALELVKEVTAPDVLISAQAYQFLDDMFKTLKDFRHFEHLDQTIECLNDLIMGAVSNEDLERILLKHDLSARNQKKVLGVLNLYRLDFLTTPAFAYAYRQFVGRNFMGDSYGIQIRVKEKGRWRRKNVGRYLTPIEVIQFMVELAGIGAKDKVFDFACGSGGFLGEIIGKVKEQTDGDYSGFIRNNLFGCDIDPFSVSTAKTFLTLLYPSLKDDFHVFQHNGLYSEDVKKPQIQEDVGIKKYIKEGIFDLIISNPPGNKEYSGTNPGFVRKKYGIETFFWDVVPFVRRAIELSNKENGRICLVVPDGYMSDSQLQFLRTETMRSCRINAVISLPRIFKYNNASMTIIYMERTQKQKSKHITLLASLPLKVRTESDEEELVNINSELSNILAKYRELERENEKNM